MKNIFVVYCVDDENKLQYCVSSGGMDFSTDINCAAQYDKDTAVRVAEYLQRTRSYKGSETGYIEIQRSVGKRQSV